MKRVASIYLHDCPQEAADEAPWALMLHGLIHNKGLKLQYSAQMCKKPMHAQVSMLIRGKLSWLRLPLSWHWRVFHLHLWWSTYGGVCSDTVGIRFYWPHTRSLWWWLEWVQMAQVRCFSRLLPHVPGDCLGNNVMNNLFQISFTSDPCHPWQHSLANLLCKDGKDLQ